METQQQNYQVAGPQQKVPCAIPSLILGIVSIVTSCCYGIPGLICAIIGLVLSGKGKSAYVANPSAYAEGSYKMLNAGRICAIIGLILSIITIIFFIIVIVIAGVEGFDSFDPESFFDSF